VRTPTDPTSGPDKDPASNTHHSSFEDLMSAKHSVSVSIIAAALAAAAGGALAAGTGASSSRALVRAEVLQARNDRTLQPAGEASQPFVVMTAASTVSRGDVRAATLQAGARHELTPAGQGPTFAVPRGTQLARADVRESVRQANMTGELIPAGEGTGPVERQARAHLSRAEIVAMRTHR
jgi:hypothetical protein